MNIELVDYRIQRLCHPRRSDILDNLHTLFYTLRHEVVTTEKSAKQNPKNRCRRGSQPTAQQWLLNEERNGLLPRARGAQCKMKRRVNILAIWIATCALLSSP